MTIQAQQHPEYKRQITAWNKYRSVYESGPGFQGNYLYKFTTKESDTDFENRKKYSHNPAFARAVVLEIKNSIHSRLADVVRTGGHESFQRAAKGELGGVDFLGNGMNAWMAREVLPELIALGKVGVFVDRASLPPETNKADALNAHPYLYVYKAENILSWKRDKQNQLTALLLRQMVEETNDHGLVEKLVPQYKLFKIIPTGVEVTIFDSNGKQEGEPGVIDLTRIPFVIFEMNQSILLDIADYQISLLNLASADMNYVIRSNVPFYIEQVDLRAQSSHLRPADVPDSDDAGTADQAKVAAEKSVTVGSHHGRAYPKGFDPPGFIAPPTDPLMASMEKQKQLREDIRRLVQLAISSIEPRRASAESKSLDAKGLEAGLSFIGLELNFGEREIAEVWSMYYNYTEPTVINYPTNYELRTDADRYEEAENLEQRLDHTPSQTLRRELAKQIATTLVGTKVSTDRLTEIHKEIDEAAVIITDAETVRSDLEAGLVGLETASSLRGYAKGEIEQAKKDHAERIARIVVAQTTARGVKDIEEPNDGAEEKEASRQTDGKGSTKRPVRGKGK